MVSEPSVLRPESMDEMEQQIMLEMSEKLEEQKQSTEALKSQIEQLVQSQAKLQKNLETMMPRFFSHTSIPPRPPSQPPDPPDFNKSNPKPDPHVFLPLLSELMSLKQHDDSVEMYSEKFDRALSRLSLSMPHAVNIFLSNMNPHLASHVKQFDVTTVAYAAWVAKIFEPSLLQTPAIQPRAPFSPYQDQNNQFHYNSPNTTSSLPLLETTKTLPYKPNIPTETNMEKSHVFGVECDDEESFGVREPSEVTVEEITDKSVDMIQEEKSTPENESSPEVSPQILLSQFQVSLSSLEPGRRYHRESLVVVNDLSYDHGCVTGKTIGSICDFEIGQDNSLDEEEFKGCKLGKLSKNERRLSDVCLLEKKEITKIISAWNNRVWEPGGVLIERDKWKWSGKCHELSIVVWLMQGLPSTRWIYEVATTFEKLAKTWKFKFKNSPERSKLMDYKLSFMEESIEKDITKLGAQQGFKIDVWSGFDLEACIGVITYGWEFKKQFKSEKSPFQHTYAAQIRRCGEMARQICFFMWSLFLQMSQTVKDRKNTNSVTIQVMVQRQWETFVMMLLTIAESLILLSDQFIFAENKGIEISISCCYGTSSVDMQFSTSFGIMSKQQQFIRLPNLPWESSHADADGILLKMEALIMPSTQNKAVTKALTQWKEHPPDQFYMALNGRNSIFHP